MEAVTWAWESERDDFKQGVYKILGCREGQCRVMITHYSSCSACTILHSDQSGSVRTVEIDLSDCADLDAKAARIVASLYDGFADIHPEQHERMRYAVFVGSD